MKTKEIQIESLEHPVTIWRMNNGFVKDWSEKATSVVATDKKKEITINSKNYNLYGLVFGILEAPSLGISKPNDEALEFGLNDSDVKLRLGKIRNLDRDVSDLIWNEVLELNKVNEDEKAETLKK